MQLKMLIAVSSIFLSTSTVFAAPVDVELVTRSDQITVDGLSSKKQILKKPKESMHTFFVMPGHYCKDVKSMNLIEITLRKQDLPGHFCTVFLTKDCTGSGTQTDAQGRAQLVGIQGIKCDLR
ncbi:hypothetical protein C8J56DRAFT_974943 [Mycena floridula]|nr:hypothetical protein C8J56DRAFT_974943 [Mycena floridula]